MHLLKLPGILSTTGTLKLLLFTNSNPQMSIYDTLRGVYRLRTSLCLQFKPHHIAAGAIFLAAKFLKVKLPSDGDKVWWQEFDVNPRQLEGCF
jgi:hypothetical protein